MPYRIAVTIATAMVLLGGITGAALLVAGPGHGPMRQPVHEVEHGFTLASLDHDVSEHYRYAAAHPRTYSMVPCYCGCDTMLGHRDLLDCFVLPEGGWESHASGCAVCLDESEMVRSGLEGGRPPPKVAAAVIEEYTT